MHFHHCGVGTSRHVCKRTQHASTVAGLFKLFSVKTCEDAGVLVNVQSALEEHLKNKVTLGSDIRLVMVRVDAGIECTVSTITSGTKETASYFVAFDEAESGTPIYRLEIMSDKITDKIVRVVVNP